MLQKTIALFLLVAFSLQTFNRVFIVLDFKLNNGAYAKNCENKAKPQMHCNGKCQMMKKLVQEEKKDQQNPDRKSENKNEYHLYSKTFFPSISKGFKQIEINPSIFLIGKTKSISTTVFHPPNLKA